MTKAIASRIKIVLPDIIHPNQTGYIKDRFMGETIRSIYDVMDFTVKENIPGLMLFVDFFKRHSIVLSGNFFFCALRHSILVQTSFTGLESSIKIYKTVS